MSSEASSRHVCPLFLVIFLSLRRAPSLLSWSFSAALAISYLIPGSPVCKLCLVQSSAEKKKRKKKKITTTSHLTMNSRWSSQRYCQASRGLFEKQDLSPLPSGRLPWDRNAGKSRQAAWRPVTGEALLIYTHFPLFGVYHDNSLLFQAAPVCI